MTTSSQPSSKPASAPATGGMSIETFTDSPLGKLIVSFLTFLSRVTVMKRKTADGKVVEKTPLDSLWGTVFAGVVVLCIVIVAIRIAIAIARA